MAPARWRVLVALVDRYDREGPVRPNRLATELNASSGVVERHLDALGDCDLVAAVPGETAYRPTITGREFLELDVDRPEHAIVASDESNDESPAT